MWPFADRAGRERPNIPNKSKDQEFSTERFPEEVRVDSDEFSINEMPTQEISEEMRQEYKDARLSASAKLDQFFKKYPSEGVGNFKNIIRTFSEGEISLEDIDSQISDVSRERLDEIVQNIDGEILSIYEQYNLLRDLVRDLLDNKDVIPSFKDILEKKDYEIEEMEDGLLTKISEINHADDIWARWSTLVNGARELKEAIEVIKKLQLIKNSLKKSA